MSMTMSEKLEFIRAGYTKDEIEAMGQDEAPPAADPVQPQEEAPPAADPAPPQEEAPPAGDSDTMAQLIGEMKLLREAIYGRRLSGQQMEEMGGDPLDEFIRRFNEPPKKKGE